MRSNIKQGANLICAAILALSQHWWSIQNGLGFKNFKSAKISLGGIEEIHNSRKKSHV